MACRDCEYFDENSKEPFFGVKGYCSYYGKYYDPGDNSYCRNFRPNNYGGTGCYITTMVHDILGMDDKSDIMETLRNFRTNVLNRNEKYKPILIDYDIIGKKIAKELRKDNDKDLCKSVYDKKLLKIAKEIKKKDYLKAITDYEQMTMGLAVYYNVPLSVNIDEEKYDYTRGGHGKVYTK